LAVLLVTTAHQPSLTAISSAAEKIPFLSVTADAPERSARGIYGQRNPTVLLKPAAHHEPSGDDVLPFGRALKAANSPDLALWRLVTDPVLF
jgi:hypothetical protein